MPFPEFTSLFLFLVPGFVTSPVAFSFGESWIHLRWAPPHPPHGQLEKYKVEYKLQSSYSYTAKEVDINKECILWDGHICFKLAPSHGITADKNYIIRVSDTLDIFITLKN
jgi:hypothetical protein